MTPPSLMTGLLLSLITIPWPCFSLCIARPVEEKFDKADVVFSAHITGLSDPRAGESITTSSDILVYEFETLHSWKGDPGYAGFLRGRRGTAAVDEVYLIFARFRPEGLWSHGSCSGSERFSHALKQRIVLGEPEVSYTAPPELVTHEFLWRAMEQPGTVANRAASILADHGLQKTLVEWGSARKWDISPGPSFDQLIHVLLLSGETALPLVRDLDPEISTSESVDVRGDWMGVLGELGEGHELANWIKRGMSDPSEWVQDVASRSTERLSGDAAQHLIGLLETQLTASDLDERENAALALSFIEELHPWTIDALCELRDGKRELNSGYSRHCVNAVKRNQDAALRSTTGKQVIMYLDQ